MTRTVEETLHVRSHTMAMTPSAPPVRPVTAQTPERGGSRTGWIVTGGILVALGANFIVGAGVVLWADQQRDDAGYFTTSPRIVATDSHALMAPSLDVSATGPDVLVGSGRRETAMLWRSSVRNFELAQWTVLIVAVLDSVEIGSHVIRRSDPDEQGLIGIGALAADPEFAQ
jgi:hypothetical protein